MWTILRHGEEGERRKSIRGQLIQPKRTNSSVSALSSAEMLPSALFDDGVVALDDDGFGHHRDAAVST